LPKGWGQRNASRTLKRRITEELPRGLTPAHHQQHHHMEPLHFQPPDFTIKIP
jgi:hypothetical protein